MKIDLILVQKTFVLIAIAFASAFSLEQLGVRLMSEKTRLDSCTVLFHWTLFNTSDSTLKAPRIVYFAGIDSVQGALMDSYEEAYARKMIDSAIAYTSGRLLKTESILTGERNPPSHWCQWLFRPIARHVVYLDSLKAKDSVNVSFRLSSSGYLNDFDDDSYQKEGLREPNYYISVYDGSNLIWGRDMSGNVKADVVLSKFGTLGKFDGNPVDSIPARAVFYIYKSNEDSLSVAEENSLSERGIRRTDQNGIYLKQGTTKVRFYAEQSIKKASLDSLVADFYNAEIDFVDMDDNFYYESYRCYNRQDLLGKLRDSLGPEIELKCSNSCREVLDGCEVNPPEIIGSTTNVEANIPYSAWECVALNPDVLLFDLLECNSCCWPLSFSLRKSSLFKPRERHQTIYKVNGTPATGDAANVQIENGQAKIRLKNFQ